MKSALRFYLGIGCTTALLISQTGCGSFCPHRHSNRTVTACGNGYAQALLMDVTDGNSCRAKPHQPGGGSVNYQTYRVMKGDSFWKISRQFDVSLKDLLDANGAAKDDILQIGQELQIPTRIEVPNTKYYAVQRGDTLSAIARREGCSVQDLRQLNHLQGDCIRVGQKLLLPSDGFQNSAANVKTPSAPAPSQDETVYAVRRGDTLSSIAYGYGMSVRELMALNDIAQPNCIREGQKLRVVKGRSSAHPAAMANASSLAISTPAPKSSDEDLLNLFDEEDLLDNAN